jgi:hypothetical protein
MIPCKLLLTSVLDEIWSDGTLKIYQQKNPIDESNRFELRFTHSSLNYDNKGRVTLQHDNFISIPLSYISKIDSNVDNLTIRLNSRSHNFLQGHYQFKFPSIYSFEKALKLIEIYLKDVSMKVTVT